jgi:hypothetical protein
MSPQVAMKKCPKIGFWHFRGSIAVVLRSVEGKISGNWGIVKRMAHFDKQKCLIEFTFSNGEDNSWLHFWFCDRWTVRFSEQWADLQIGASDGSVATDVFGEKAQFFQNHPSRLEETEHQVKTTANSHVSAEFVGALQGRRPEDKMCNIGGLQAFRSEFGFEELFSTLDSFDAAPLQAGSSFTPFW